MSDTTSPPVWYKLVDEKTFEWIRANHPATKTGLVSVGIGNTTAGAFRIVEKAAFDNLEPFTP